MMERLKLYPNFTGINACLSKDFGTVDFYQASNNGASSSILKPHRHLNHYPEVAFKKPIKLESVPLDSLNLGRFDLIVMDVQGAEHLVIEGGGKAICFGRCDLLGMQFWEPLQTGH
jgi:FkbM family methyltransferase